MLNTSKYINVVSNIVNNYNDSYHSGIKNAPRDVENKDESIIKLTNRKYNKALSQETKFNIGDEVRFIKNRSTFQKGSRSTFPQCRLSSTACPAEVERRA